MCTHSEEGDTECIGIFNLHVKKFQSGMKVPHMGWNSLHDLRGRMFDESINDEFVYFVHSYYAPCGVDTSAIVGYINPFSAALERGNFCATQFHPEKSGPVGERILRKFIEL